MSQTKLVLEKLKLDGVIKRRKVFAKVYTTQNDLHWKLFSHNSNSIIKVADSSKSRYRK